MENKKTDQKIRVRIGTCGLKEWYRYQVGNEFYVEEANSSYYEIVDHEYHTGSLILKSDCEVIPPEAAGEIDAIKRKLKEDEDKRYNEAPFTKSGKKCGHTCDCMVQDDCEHPEWRFRKTVQIDEAVEPERKEGEKRDQENDVYEKGYKNGWDDAKAYYGVK